MLNKPSSSQHIVGQARGVTSIGKSRVTTAELQIDKVLQVGTDASIGSILSRHLDNRWALTAAARHEFLLSAVALSAP
jgi:hypothetical protein